MIDNSLIISLIFSSSYWPTVYALSYTLAFDISMRFINFVSTMIEVIITFFFVPIYSWEFVMSLHFFVNFMRVRA